MKHYMVLWGLCLGIVGSSAEAGADRKDRSSLSASSQEQSLSVEKSQSKEESNRRLVALQRILSSEGTSTTLQKLKEGLASRGKGRDQNDADITSVDATLFSNQPIIVVDSKGQYLVHTGDFSLIGQSAIEGSHALKAPGQEEMVVSLFQKRLQGKINYIDHAYGYAAFQDEAGYLYMTPSDS